MKQSSSGLAATVITLATVTALLVAPAVAATATPPAGYTAAEDVSSDFIKQVGKFAVTVYKLARGVSLYYVSTSQCWSKPAGGGADDYWMVLTATNGAGAAGSYVATVWGIPGSESKTWKLLSFNATS
uniref:Cysteine proteinase inhibitor n=1 Tax=Oryza meridionalis TaxID=40149 RepID=A0A0E0EXH0_9ORYZ